MIRLRHLPLLLAASSLCAQSFVVPPGTTPDIGTCNAFPFSTTDMRYQALVRATDLGSAAGVITGLALSPCASGVRTMRAITIKMAHFNAVTMTTTFDSNLNSPGPAQTVLDTVNHQWHMVANTWNEIGLQSPFFYNGVDDLVVEVLVIGSSGTAASTHREATNQRVYLGGYTGQLSGTNGGNTAFKMKLFLGDANTQTFGAGCVGSAGTPTFSFTGTAQLGTQLDLNCNSAPASTPTYFLIGLNSDLPVFPIDMGAGCTLYHDVLVAAGLLSNVAGNSSLPLFVPVTPSLAGAVLYCSALVIDPPANANGFTLTNYGRALLGN